MQRLGRNVQQATVVGRASTPKQQQLSTVSPSKMAQVIVPVGQLAIGDSSEKQIPKANSFLRKFFPYNIVGLAKAKPIEATKSIKEDHTVEATDMFPPSNHNRSIIFLKAFKVRGSKNFSAILFEQATNYRYCSLLYRRQPVACISHVNDNNSRSCVLTNTGLIVGFSPRVWPRVTLSPTGIPSERLIEECRVILFAVENSRSCCAIFYDYNSHNYFIHLTAKHLYVSIVVHALRPRVIQCILFLM